MHTARMSPCVHSSRNTRSLASYPCVPVGGWVRAWAPARRVAVVGLALGLSVSLFNALVIVSLHGVWGRLFSEDADVIALVARVLLIYAVFAILDGGVAVRASCIPMHGRCACACVYGPTHACLCAYAYAWIRAKAPLHIGLCAPRWIGACVCTLCTDACLGAACVHAFGSWRRASCVARGGSGLAPS
jgi:Na+-driven multidrug efflux pump